MALKFASVSKSDLFSECLQDFLGQKTYTKLFWRERDICLSHILFPLVGGIGQIWSVTTYKFAKL